MTSRVHAGWATPPVRRNDCPIRDRYREVLQLAANGHTNAEIGEAMGYAKNTVDQWFNRDIRADMDARNRTHAVANALRNGWIE